MNGDITLAALRQCKSVSKVVSPFIIFAVFDVSFRRYNLYINYSFYIYICCFITAVQMSTAGIFLSRNLCLSVLLRCTKFRVNETVYRRDIAEKRLSLWRPSAMLNLQNCGTMSCDCPWKRNSRLHTKLHWNRMIPGWDIAIKPFSKWRPTAILNLPNLGFWSCVVC